MAITLPSASDSTDRMTSIPCQSADKAAQGLDQQAHGHGKGGDLGRAADEQRHRRGRAVVDVRHPHVERHRAELEGQPDHHETQAEDQHHAVLAGVRQRRGDGREVEAAGGAVQHGHAVEQHAGGQRTQHEILHGGFRGRRGIAVEGHHRVQRQRQQFQAEVQVSRLCAEIITIMPSTANRPST